MDMLFDMHCHLSWFAHGADVARHARDLGLCVFANTVTPSDHKSARDTFDGHDNIAVGVGAHPWWIADGRLGRKDIVRAAELAYESAYVGEIGLDFSLRHAPADSHQTQVVALRTILGACDAGARANARKVLSLHAVRSAGTVLDLLEESGCMESCACILHWFSGTSDELHRAVRSGCHFSVNEMMLRTRRGREYARQLPAERLLTETDLPPASASDLGADDIIASLEQTLGQLKELRGADMHETASNNAQSLLKGARPAARASGGNNKPVMPYKA